SENEISIQIQQITPTDVERATDSWTNLLRMVARHEATYPNISRWMNDRVRPAIATGNRQALLATFHGVPVAAAVAKLGPRAKICHLSVDDSYQNCHLGELLFTAMSLRASYSSKSLYFTLPSSLWESKRGFFSGFAFQQAVRSGRQYRL